MTATTSGDAPDWLMPMTSDRSSRGCAPYSEMTDGVPSPTDSVVPDTEHVLGVDRRVVARAAGGDDDVIDPARADRVGERPDDLGRPAQEPGGDLGLLEDLVAKTHDPMVSDRDAAAWPAARRSADACGFAAGSHPDRMADPTDSGRSANRSDPRAIRQFGHERP